MQLSYQQAELGLSGYVNPDGSIRQGLDTHVTGLLELTIPHFIQAKNELAYTNHPDVVIARHRTGQQLTYRQGVTAPKLGVNAPEAKEAAVTTGNFEDMDIFSKPAVSDSRIATSIDDLWGSGTHLTQRQKMILDYRNR